MKHRHVAGHAQRVAALVAWLAVVLSACGAGLAPVLNVDHAPVTVPAGVAPTRPYVRDAIVRALSSRGWSIEQEAPAGIIATYTTGKHFATVYVPYDEHSFSIHYVDSSPSLKYDGRAIHRRYNSWVDHLDSAIRAQLALANPPPTAVPPPAAASTPAPSTAPPAAANAAAAPPASAPPPSPAVPGTAASEAPAPPSTASSAPAAAVRPPVAAPGPAAPAAAAQPTHPIPPAPPPPPPVAGSKGQ